MDVAIISFFFPFFAFYFEASQPIIRNNIESSNNAAIVIKQYEERLFYLRGLFYNQILYAWLRLLDFLTTRAPQLTFYSADITRNQMINIWRNIIFSWFANIMYNIHTEHFKRWKVNEMKNKKHFKKSLRNPRAQISQKKKN